MAKENLIDLRRISDGAAKHLHALQALKRPTTHWDDVLVLILNLTHSCYVSGKLLPTSCRRLNSC